jgi:hypothetical protein
MSQIKLAPNASGSGIFTLESPNSNTNRTLTLPDAAGTIQVSGNPISGTTGSFSGDLSFNSGYGSSAVAYGCRAWVNFNGTGTVAIRASGNVTSITDNGTGNYTVNFTTSMPDVNFSIAGYTVNPASRALVFGDVNTYATGSIRVNTGYITGFNGEATSIDATYVNIAVFR